MIMRTLILRTLALPLAVAVSACGESNDGEEGVDGATNPWAGNTYVLTVPESNWSEPDGVGRDIGAFVPPFVIQMNETGALVGTLDPVTGVQDPCTPTTVFPAPSTANPHGVLGPVDTRLHLVNNAVQVVAPARAMTLTAVLPTPDGVTTADGELTAVLDARDVASLFTLLPNPTPDTLCETLQTQLAVSCEPCAHDPQQLSYCLPLRALFLGAQLTPTVSLVPVDEATIPATCKTPAQ